MDPADLIPPLDQLPAYATRGDFLEAGRAFLETSIDMCELDVAARVLDIGCGVGRFAVALTQYLSPAGRYEGLDVKRRPVALATEYITSRFPNFRFTVADVFNGMYRQDGSIEGGRFRFPFDDASFDFVFSNSLYTHLLPEDAANYLRETARVLAPGGRALNTMFLLNPDVLAQLRRRPEAAGALLRETTQRYRIKDPDNPEKWVAYDEDYMVELHHQAGLTIRRPIRYGAWGGRRPSGPGFGKKDIVVAAK